MRPILAHARPLAVAAAAAAAAVGQAAPATADEDGYLRVTQARFAFLSAAQLTAEGSKICGLTRSGVPASDAVLVVQRDLGVSVPAAYDIVNAAVVHIGC
jgi:hypothetical protein